jgi:HSP20 family protein
MYRPTSIFNAVDDLFEFANHNSSTYSKAEVRQTDEGFSLDILLPGFTKEEVNVKAEGNELVVEAKTERTFPKFLNRHVRKAYQVEDLDSESVVAKLEAGLLNLTFSTSKKKNARNISIL